MQGESSSSNCIRHPQQRVIGVCMSKQFVGKGIARYVCAKCMSIYCKQFPEFILLDDLEASDVYQIDQFPFSPSGQQLKQHLMENQNGKSTEKKQIFKAEIDLLERLSERINTVKMELKQLSDEINKCNSQMDVWLKHEFENKYNFKSLKTAFETQNEENIESQIANLSATPNTQNFLGIFNEMKTINKHEDISLHLEQITQRIITHSLSEQVDTLLSQILSQISHIYSVTSTIMLQNDTNTAHKESQKHIEILQPSFESVQSSQETDILSRLKQQEQAVQLVRSKVPYPDALNLVLYSKDNFDNGKLSFEINLLPNQQLSYEKCHFFVGMIDADLKDTLGYNHDMPALCLFCFLKQKGINLEDHDSSHSLRALVQFDLNNNTTQYQLLSEGFKDSLEGKELTTIIPFQFQPFKDWKLFVNMCFQIQFKVYRR